MPLNPTKLLPSVFPHEKSRMSRMTLAIGTGRTGTPIPSSIVSSSCSVSSTDCTLPPAHICIHVNAMQPVRLWQPQYILCLYRTVLISRVRFLRLGDHVHCMNAFRLGASPCGSACANVDEYWSRRRFGSIVKGAAEEQYSCEGPVEPAKTKHRKYNASKPRFSNFGNKSHR